VDSFRSSACCESSLAWDDRRSRKDCIDSRGTGVRSYPKPMSSCVDVDVYNIT
jgi:hypothetical protein